jgi:hypothetical protein
MKSFLRFNLELRNLEVLSQNLKSHIISGFSQFEVNFETYFYIPKINP